MAREFEFSDPLTRRLCEEDYISPPFLDQPDVPYTAATGQNTAAPADAGSSEILIGTL